MAITLKDVAERAGVSRSAVSRTFTEGASVSEETRAKVRQAADELGYSPNFLASSLTTGRTKLIGLVSDNFRNPIFLNVFDLLTRSLQARGLRPLLVNLTDETDPARSLALLQQYSVDAVIVASSTLPESFAHSFQDAGVPVVHSFGRHRPNPRVHVVGIDNVAAGRLAAQTLLSRGYESIAMMAGPAGATSTQDRLAGFMQVMAEHPGRLAGTTFAEAYSFQAGREEMARLLSGERAEAYFCGDDVLSIGALSAATSAGLRVPDDVGFIGVNDMEMAGWESNNLTTLRNPIEEIVAASTSLVDDMLAGVRPPEAHLFPCALVERGTLRPVAADMDSPL
ncbi:MAG: LacI family transcriptional regulator [Rhodobacteraceae bacterium]|nr:LacI family transcriptional regulator [Paracoccaceae bacterium]